MPWIIYVQVARQPPDVSAPKFRHIHRCDDFLQQVFSEQVVYFFYRVHFMLSLLSRQPNQSPEPTAIGRFSLFHKVFGSPSRGYAVAQLFSLGHIRALKNMKNDKPFQKAFACAGVLFAIIVIIMVATGQQRLSYRIGYVFSTCLIPALVTGTWGHFSKKTWTWGRFAATVIGFYLLFGAIMISGNTHR